MSNKKIHILSVRKELVTGGFHYAPVVSEDENNNYVIVADESLKELQIKNEELIYIISNYNFLVILDLDEEKYLQLNNELNLLYDLVNSKIEETVSSYISASEILSCAVSEDEIRKELKTKLFENAKTKNLDEDFNIVDPEIYVEDIQEEDEDEYEEDEDEDEEDYYDFL